MDIFEKPITVSVIRHVAVIAAYVLAAKIVLDIFLANGVVSILWPSSGIALAALLLGGKRYLPSIFAAAFMANLLAGNTLGMAFIISIGNVLEAAIAASILWRDRLFDTRLIQARDYVALAFAGALASMTAAMIGVSVLWYSGILLPTRLFENAVHWWQGDVLGILLVTPLVLVWNKWPGGWLDKSRVTETLLLLVLTFIAGQIVFMGWLSEWTGGLAESYWMFLFVAWSSVRFGRHGVLLVIMLTATQALLGILQNVSVVDDAVINAQLHNYWFYMLVLSIIGIILSLVIYQRRQDQLHLVELKENAELALANLNESEDRHRIFFENSKDALMTSEPPLNTFTSGNREAIAMFGLRNEKEFLKLGPLDLAPEFQPDGQKSIDKAMQVVDEALKNGFCYFEWTHKRITGEEFPCNILLTAASIGGKSVIQAAVRDITSQKKAEKALYDMNHILETKVHERTHELANAKIVAEQATREKSEFLANMSHEIRTPITSVLGMSYLALKTALNEKQRDYVEKIQISAQHLLGLIDSVLDFSKLEAGQVVLEDIDFNLDHVIDTVNTLVREKAASKGLDIVVDIEGILDRRLRGDPLRLSQILINYVNNAIKFSSSGNIVVRIRALESSSREYFLRFEVQDQGIGIPLEEQQNIFESFRQGHASTARKYGGSGLGLAISKQLAEMMRGSVGVSSQPGQGSRFWFTARLSKSNGVIVPMPVESYSTDAGFEYRKSMSGLKILLAEDNVINQQVATELLEMVGVNVTVVGNGKEAIERLGSEAFDCVLMDIQMPVMDGLEAIRQIRANKALANTVVIAMTANAWAEDQQQCIDAGMDNFVSKPVKPSHLYAVITQSLASDAPAAGVDGKHDAPKVSVVTLPDEIPVYPAGNAGFENPAIIDIRILAESLGNDMDQLLEFVSGRFVESTQKGINEMKTALQVDDVSLLRNLGHKYKSSAKTVGAIGFAELCQCMEQLPDDNYYQDAKFIIEKMQSLLLIIMDTVKA